MARFRCPPEKRRMSTGQIPHYHWLCRLYSRKHSRIVQEAISTLGYSSREINRPTAHCTLDIFISKKAAKKPFLRNPSAWLERLLGKNEGKKETRAALPPKAQKVQKEGPEDCRPYTGPLHPSNQRYKAEKEPPQKPQDNPEKKAMSLVTVKGRRPLYVTDQGIGQEAADLRSLGFELRINAEKDEIEILSFAKYPQLELQLFSDQIRMRTEGTR